MFGKLDKVSGNQILVTLDDELNLNRLRKFANGKQPIVELQVDDGRQISPDQRKKIFAMLHDMSSYTGYDIREMEQEMKYRFYAKTGADQFSMSDCSMTTANQFLTYLLDFCFENGIPFKTKTWDAIPTSPHLALQCLRHRKCVICGQHADIHHWTAVGNRSRKLVDHRKLYFMALCPEIHHKEFHDIGAASFFKKYHVKPIRLGEQDLIDLHIMTRSQMNYWNDQYSMEGLI